MNESFKLLEEVQDEQSFLLFVKSLIKNHQSSDDWENNTIRDLCTKALTADLFCHFPPFASNA